MPQQAGKTQEKGTSSTVRSAKAKRGSGAKLVYETLKDEILELRQTPGVPLDETGLAERFGLSRSPIREALVRLSSEGLVEVLSNRSTIVAPLNLVEFPRYVEALDYLQRVVTRLAARNRTAVDLERMTAAAEAYDDTCREGNPLKMSEANKAFHITIAEAAQNPYFTTAYGRLLDEGRRILHMHYFRRRESDDRYPLGPEHFDMIEAIRRQDEDEASRLAHEHTRMFHDRLLEFMQANYVADID